MGQCSTASAAPRAFAEELSVEPVRPNKEFIHDVKRLEQYLSGFLFRNLRLLVEDLRQTLLSLGIFWLDYWLSHLGRF